MVVWNLDRLTRSLKDMLLILEKIEAVGAGFRSLTEAIDTTTPAGRMMMQMLGSFAEFERAIVRERTTAARERGRKGGRRPKLTSDQRAEFIGMLNDGRPAAEIARLLRVHRATVGRIGAEAKIAVCCCSFSWPFSQRRTRRANLPRLPPAGSERAICRRCKALKSW